MLDTETKRRIDSARDILVGKVPDPKSQVEQITIALIYKFMADMDAESEEMGGKRTFFKDEWERYGWPKLMRSGLGGHEVLALYGEAISKMPENAGIPALFRDIFKNAYLPYRDPETLKSFLKIIDEFEYDHSERLGDAFEYLLSVLGSQGDAGQFRTPRHIIDFMVEIVDPKKGETILDPACGTAGFLISSYKHIARNNQDKDGNTTLTPDDKGRLAKNFKGYDISPDMVRLSLVNLYLHGFTDPHIDEYDTLTSDDKWNEFVDVILANPPFMSPKGGIKPHKRFSVQSKRSEVLFVDYIAEHLTPNGRAAVIVPEGIIFQSQTAYKQLRKMLVEQYLVAVVSLPAGVFQPYSGVKTSILVFDKSLAKQSDTIGFFKAENDGFGLGSQRRKIESNDLPQIRSELEEYLTALRNKESVEELLPTRGLIVDKTQIGENGEYNLSGARYRADVISSSTFPMVPVGDFYRQKVSSFDPRKVPEEAIELWSIPAFDAGSPELLLGGEIGSQKKEVIPGDILLSRIVPHIRRGWVVTPSDRGFRQLASTEWIVFASERVAPEYLRRVVTSDSFHEQFMQTITGVGGSLSRANPKAVAEIQIPLPPLEVQKEIVAEIEGYQKVIDGARAVLDNYRPHIPIHPDWPVVPLGALAENLDSKRVPITKGDRKPGPYPYYGASGVVDHVTDFIFDERLLLISEDGANLLARSTPIAFTVSEKCWVNNHAHVLRFPDPATEGFVETYLNSISIAEFVTGAAQPKLNQKALNGIPIPIPESLAERETIISEINAELKLVASNQELVERMDKKIQAAIARVWGEEEAEAIETE